jgi:hypothetical protein
MGSLVYDGRTTHFDDRTLLHLQIVIVQKLERNERLLMSWKEGVAPDVPLLFRFTEHAVAEVDEAWLEKLGSSANSRSGLVVMDVNGDLIEADASTRGFPGNM